MYINKYKVIYNWLIYSISIWYVCMYAFILEYIYMCVVLTSVHWLYVVIHVIFNIHMDVIHVWNMAVCLCRFQRIFSCVFVEHDFSCVFKFWVGGPHCGIMINIDKSEILNRRVVFIK